jgi:predicted nuclease of predicted toxin-antitoxin system
LLKILADENINFRIIKELRNNSFDVISILESHRGVSDKEVLELARNYKALLLTEDRDFGILVFAFKEKNISVIFLRYYYTEVNYITSSLIKVLNKYNLELYGKFVTITPKKVKIIEL